VEIKIAPKALEDLEELTEDQEDLESFFKALEKAVSDGSFFEDSEPVDMEKLKEEEPDVYKKLIESLEDFDDLKLN
jgi:hypothetical protein